VSYYSAVPGSNVGYPRINSEFYRLAVRCIFSRRNCTLFADSSRSAPGHRRATQAWSGVGREVSSPLTRSQAYHIFDSQSSSTASQFRQNSLSALDALRASTAAEMGAHGDSRVRQHARGTSRTLQPAISQASVRNAIQPWLHSPARANPVDSLRSSSFDR
jgi:hypothetical protein